MTAQPHSPARAADESLEPAEPDWPERFAQAVAETPYVEAALWIELVPAIEVPPEVINTRGRRPIAIGALQIVVAETEDSGWKLTSLRGQGVRLALDGTADGRSRPIMYELPREIAQAIMGHPRVQRAADADAASVDVIWQAANAAAGAT